ncbi:hypothetical protein EA472_13145 [Natrarchaeobius oligotrophus]|uniref:Uncharacterized protein n=1 Tax=Natrarchaeobius chitinivorans TaxID=1679083 RepID=A0A3N6M7J5_NATCH|nr:hypothetical protein EA472_13145 [Natrarchaeobius chitinivorans]
MQQTPKGSECELLAAEDRIYVRVSSAEADLQEICQAAHTEFQWLWDKDGMAYIDHTSVNVVKPD